MRHRIIGYLVVMTIIGLLATAGLAQTGTPLPVFPITPGSSVEGNINDTVFSVRYSFEAQAGATVTIRMQPTSGNLDPFLLLFSPDGDLLEQNDDEDTTSGSRDSLIELTIQQAGAYVVEATRFQGEIGPSTGTYRLTLEVDTAPAGGSGLDPLSVEPAFGVPFDYIDYQEFRAGVIEDSAAKQYFAVGGQQGDLVRVTMTNTGGDLVPAVSIRNADLTPISREAQAGASEAIVYATLPETGWYLVEASSRGGIGSFGVYVDRRAVAVAEIGERITGEFTAEVDTVSYIINAHIGDQVIATIFADDPNSGILPELRLLDLSLRSLATSRAIGDPSARVRAFIGRTTIPRSAPYILQVTNLRGDVTGGFDLRITGVPVDIAKLSEEIAIPVSYNNLYKGAVDDNTPVVYYRFSGKVGELVTLQMNATDGDLDPYLILADSQLNELAFNDNVGATSNARIAQFALPADGTYFIIATRANLALGGSAGLYDLSLTVGQIALLPGPLTVTLTWESDADLNLFVRDPSGRIASWSRSRTPGGATLQVDSNTRCQIPTTQPVEHIYWTPTTPPELGEYAIWVWYQNVCTRGDPVTFGLKVTVDGETKLDIKPGTFTLQPDQRLDATLLLTASGSFVTNPGQVITPSAQRRASEGGDSLIRYGQSLTGTITNQVFAIFYQFVASEGDEVSVTAETLTGTLDPYIVLRDDTDNNLASNDDVNTESRNSALTYTIPQDGLYVIAVTRYGLRDGTTTGDFRLTLTKQN